MAKAYIPSCHAAVTRQIAQGDMESAAMQSKTLALAKSLGVTLDVKFVLTDPEQKIRVFVRHAAKKAKHCKCGSLHCPSCGFVKFHRRVARVANSQIAGYACAGIV